MERASRRPSVCLAIPALIASLGSVTDSLNYSKDCAYVNEFPVAVEDQDVGNLRTITEEVIGLTSGHDFDWKAFWNSNPEWACFKLTLD